MTEVLHIKTSGIPKLRCFDENTIIDLKNGAKTIKDVEVGEILKDGSYITAKIKVTSTNLKMYCINKTIVSETHLINYKDKWIRVGEHPEAKNIIYNKDYLYCLNTSNKILNINGHLFSDWDEIVNLNKWNMIKMNSNIRCVEDIHKKLDEGFHENTLIDGKYIKDVEIGDILSNGSVVYGKVEVYATNIYNPKLRKNYVSLKYLNKKNKIYHLLTNDGNLIIDGTNVKDYNNVIDKFII